MKKLLIYAAVVLAILFVALLAGSAWMAHSTRSWLAVEQAKVKAAGEPLTMADIKRVFVPDEQNAYFYLMQARGDLEAFDKQFMEMEVKPALRQSPGQLAELAKLVEQYPQMYELLERAAACPGYEADLDYDQGFELELTHLDAFRSAARAMQAKALVQANEGAGDAAISQCERSLRLSTHLSTEPMLISSLVNIACQTIAQQSSNHVLRVAETSPEARQQLDDVLAGIDNQQAALNALKTERALGGTTFAQLRAGKVNSVTADAPSAAHWFAETWIGSAYLHDDETKYLQVMARSIEAAQLSPDQRRTEFAQLEQELTKGGVRHILSRLILPAVRAANMASTRAEALNRCLRVLLALQGKDETATLKSLNLPADVTTDPFSGKPLVVKRVGDEWLVYSVGENGADDGGKFDSTKGPALDLGFGPLEPPAAPMVQGGASP